VVIGSPLLDQTMQRTRVERRRLRCLCRARVFIGYFSQNLMLIASNDEGVPSTSIPWLIACFAVLLFQGDNHGKPVALYHERRLYRLAPMRLRLVKTSSTCQKVMSLCFFFMSSNSCTINRKATY
jgi:hypothetical protein